MPSGNHWNDETDATESTLDMATIWLLWVLPWGGFTKNFGLLPIFNIPLWTWFQTRNCVILDRKYWWFAGKEKDWGWKGDFDLKSMTSIMINELKRKQYQNQDNTFIKIYQNLKIFTFKFATKSERIITTTIGGNSNNRRKRGLNFLH